MTVAGVVLCGGQSSRMGQDKATLQWQGQDLLSHQMATLSACDLSEVHCSGPQGIADEQEGLGPLSGILSCLNCLCHHQALLFIPVDMPLLTTAVCQSLLEQKSNKQVIQLEGHMFPLLIQNTHEIREILAQRLLSGQRSIFGCLKVMDVQVIEHSWPEQLFINTNSPEEWLSIQ